MYRAYGSVTDFKNYQGNPMPEWRDLPPKIQEAWRAAAGVSDDEIAELQKEVERLEKIASPVTNSW